MITSEQPASLIIIGATSPVCAPKSFCTAQSWAATRILDPSSRSDTVLRAVKTGAITTSQGDAFATSGFKARAVSTDSPISLNIFQLPAITGFLILLVVQSGHAGQRYP